jgi:hypothetical protein
MMGALLVVFTLFGNYDSANENAADKAVGDYARNKTVILPAGHLDKMLVRSYC